ncbi:LysE family translocator [Pseudooceanicola nitratireducens]|uniref:LysE family translocator n=1 Tax=Pseudooceanicola nitratireducens TaxID=517719 RepID=UPI001C96BD87|nr:LysE family translocator [Pseudooceanicola nitratireducens]MBY6166222.1 LysE family translocator [Pseudooceanicola nitratireducens]
MTPTIIALVVFLFPLAYSPGPGNMFFAANGARFGLRATLPANAGYHVATWVVAMVIGFGALKVFEAYPHLFDVLKLIGSGYVLWLAIKLFRAGGVGDIGDARPAGFTSGVVLLLFNPKAYVILLLMFSQFTDPAASDKTATVLLIASIFTLNNLGAFLVWTAVGDRLARRFRDTQQARGINRVFGLLLAGVAVWMVVA